MALSFGRVCRVGRDAVEVGLDELVAGQAVIAERLLDLRNRRLLNLEVGGEDGRGHGCKASGHGKDVLFHHVSFVESVSARPERGPPGGVWTTCRDMQSPPELQQPEIRVPRIPEFPDTCKKDPCSLKYFPC